MPEAIGNADVRPLTIIELRAENMKRIQAVEIHPDNPLVVISGQNGQGKTSVLDTISWAIESAKGIQPNPIRTGQDDGSIRLDLGEFIVHRTFKRSTKEGGPSFTTTVRVEAASGAKYSSPQAVLNGLMGKLSLDPVAFLKLDEAQKFDVLRAFVPGVDFDSIEKENKTDFDRRTQHNRDAKAKRAAADQIQVQANLPAVREDEDALLAKLTQAAANNEALAKERARRAAAIQSVTDDAYNIAKIEQEILALQARKAGIVAHKEATCAANEAWEDLPEDTDVAATQAAIQAARATNAAIAQRDRKEALVREADDLEWEAEDCTRLMDERNKAKKDAIAAAKMPIPGLDLADGRVLYDGELLQQASSAQQLRVSVAIAMAGNPRLRVLLVRDGNCLDGNGMAILAEMARENGYQIWIEKVTDGEAVGFVIEDGMIKEAA